MSVSLPHRPFGHMLRNGLRNLEVQTAAPSKRAKICTSESPPTYGMSSKVAVERSPLISYIRLPRQALWEEILCCSFPTPWSTSCCQEPGNQQNLLLASSSRTPQRSFSWTAHCSSGRRYSLPAIDGTSTTHTGLFPLFKRGVWKAPTPPSAATDEFGCPSTATQPELSNAKLDRSHQQSAAGAEVHAWLGKPTLFSRMRATNRLWSARAVSTKLSLTPQLKLMSTNVLAENITPEFLHVSPLRVCRNPCNETVKNNRAGQ